MPIIFAPVPPVIDHPPPDLEHGHCLVQLGSMSLNATDGFGAAWTCELPKGWSGSPGSSARTEQRAGKHGGWSPTPFYGSRYLELTGTVSASSHRELHEALRRLNTACTLAPTTLRVTEDDGRDLFAVVRRDGEVVHPPITEIASKWSLSIVAEDPLRYSVVEQSATLHLGSTTGGWTIPVTIPWTISSVTVNEVISVVNNGDSLAQPRFRINGPVTNPILQQPETGRQMPFYLTLAAGEWLTVDTASRSVSFLDQVSRLHTLQGSQWLEFPPGTSSLRFLAATYSPDANVVATWRDAYA